MAAGGPQRPAGEASGIGIRLLSDALIDQIAAGEVVERPASVVKELVENALDAGASRIRVEVRDGGRAFLAVSDDGLGMSPKDARLALQRHATSKLRTADDLDRIASFGFRGEALPAIASVSRLRLVTRPRGADTGHEIRIDHGEPALEREAGCPEGTRVEVADLFASVPARRKFLKRAATEWGHIAEWIGRLALALPGVHFELARDDRPPVVWPACGEVRERVDAVLGGARPERWLEIECEEAVGHLHALVSPPEYTRANANALHLFVNGRPVRDKTMRHALLEAYRDVLPKGRYPAAVVYLALPEGSVDVNVHPAKWEVRFQDAAGIHRLIRRGVRDAMAERSWLADRPTAPAGAPTAKALRPRPSAEERVRERPVSDDWIFASRGAARSTEGSALDRDPAAVPGPAEGEEAGRLHFAELRPLGQLLASYLVVESEEGLLLVDQHAAHERVLYERMRAQWLDRGVEAQRLLLPVSLERSAATVARLADVAGALDRLGFEVEPFGETALVVRAVPAIVGAADPGPLLDDLLEALAHDAGGGAPGPERVRDLAVVDRLLATWACHAARRFGDHLEPAEQRALLAELDTIPWAPTCPHGRPVAVRFDRGEIERRFRRR